MPQPVTATAGVAAGHDTAPNEKRALDFPPAQDPQEGEKLAPEEPASKRQRTDPSSHQDAEPAQGEIKKSFSEDEGAEDPPATSSVQEDVADVPSTKNSAVSEFSLPALPQPLRGSIAHPLDGDEMYGMLPSFPDDNIIIGIDEAGRGPVLGPMVYGLAFAPENADLKERIATELDDSKKLSLQQRESMFENVQKNVGWIAHVSSAERLSRDMTGSTKVSLNLIAQHATVNSIKYVLQQRNKNAFKKVSALYVDTVGDPDRYQRILKDAFPQIPTVVVAKKADSLYKIVSAASVVAKVVRDGLLEHHQFSEERVQEVQEHLPGAPSSEGGSQEQENGISTGRGGGVRITSRDFGCGYPGDKTTIKWLEKNLQHVFGFPKLVRFSWETADKMMEKNCAAVDFYEEAPGEASGGASGGRQLPLTAFFAKPSQPVRKKAFLSRGLGIATEF